MRLRSSISVIVGMATVLREAKLVNYRYQFEGFQVNATFAQSIAERESIEAQCSDSAPKAA
jgi:predicted restriction endonuclease